MLVTLTVTWSSLDDKNNTAIVAENLSLLKNLSFLNKTDGYAVAISPLIVQREFVDIPSADEYTSKLIQSCVANNVTPPTITTRINAF